MKFKPYLLQRVFHADFGAGTILGIDKDLVRVQWDVFSSGVVPASSLCRACSACKRAPEESGALCLRCEEYDQDREF